MKVLKLESFFILDYLVELSFFKISSKVDEFGHISHEKSFEYIEIIFPKPKSGQKNRQ
jgi:hypothetical protein